MSSLEIVMGHGLILLWQIIKKAGHQGNWLLIKQVVIGTRYQRNRLSREQVIEGTSHQGTGHKDIRT
jgi:hypothetical protein